MDKILNILDVRGVDSKEALAILQKQVKHIKNNECIWLIDDHEPDHCYHFLIEHDFNFHTFIVQPNEYRIFISLF